MRQLDAKHRIILALDVTTPDAALSYVHQLAPYVSTFLIGSDLLAVAGPRLIHEIHREGGNVFLDQRLCDEPGRTARFVMNMQTFGVEMLSVHLASGKRSVEAAIRASGDTKIVGVSNSEDIDVAEYFQIFGQTPEQKAIVFAYEFSYLGGDTIICAPQHVQSLKSDPLLLQASSRRPVTQSKPLSLIVNGVFPAWVPRRQNAFTPAQAILAGADYLVIGEPLLHPPREVGTNRDMDPSEAAKLILDEVNGALRQLAA